MKQNGSNQMNLTLVSFLNFSKIYPKRNTSRIDFKRIIANGFAVTLKNRDKTKGQNGGLQVAFSEAISEFVSEYTLKSAMFLAIIR